MLRLSLAAAALLFAPLAAPLAAEPAVAIELNASDRASIEQIYEQWAAAWNSHDPVAFASLFHDDGTWVLWTGGTWVGRPAIESGMRGAFKRVYANSTQIWRTAPEIRMLAPGVAVGRALSNTMGDSRQPGVTIYGNKMLIFTQRDGKWLILYGQNSRLTDDEIAKLKTR